MRFPSTRRHSLTRAGAAALLLTVVALLAGCGGHGKVYLNEDTVDVVPDIAPVLEYSTITIEGSRVIICYSLIDPDGNPIDITPEYSTDNGITFRNATEELGLISEGVVALSSSATGTGHCYVWDSAADGVGTTAPATVVIRMTPFDSLLPGLPVVSGPIEVFNPQITIDIGSTSGLYGSFDLCVPITLNTGGTAPGAASVDIQFDSALLSLAATPLTDGPVTIAAGGVLTLTGLGAGRVRVDVAAPVALTDGVFANLCFNSMVPVTPVAQATPLTCTAAAAADVSSAPIGAGCGQSGSVFLFPNMPPTCAVSAPLEGAMFTTLTGFLGTLPVGYTLQDPEGDLADVTVEFSTDMGATWSLATEIPGPPSDGTTNLLTSPLGTSHVFTWDANTDVPGLTMTASPALIRISPATAGGGILGPSCLSGNFTIDLRNAPPTCVQPLGTAGTSGDISVIMDIDDVETDNVMIFVEYESPLGSGFVAATAAPTSPLPNPAMSVPTPAMGLVFLWNSVADIGQVVQDVNFRITVGDAFNPLNPPAPVLNSCTGGPITIDNTACVFASLRVLGPGSALGAGTNTVGGGPTATDPCTIGDDYTFSLGSFNMGQLTATRNFSAGGNPLVFDDAGQMLSVIAEGTFTGVCVGLIDVTAGMTAYGMTTYTVTPGFGGPYIQSNGNGSFTSLATVPNAMSGCDVVTVTFTPNGLGTMGGANGSPGMSSFAACVDYFGWDDASRNGLGFLPVGAFDASMPGTPSGETLPGAGGTVHLGVYAKANPTDIASAFDMEFAYDPAFMTPDTGFGINGAQNCQFAASPWTITPNPMFMGNNFLVNGFRITTVMGSSQLAVLAFSRVAAGGTILTGLQKEWADSSATRIPGPQPLPWINPAMGSGFTLP